MIVRHDKRHLLQASQRFRIFAVCTQGNDIAGVAGQVGRQIGWKELARIRNDPLGHVLFAECDGGVIFCALACYDRKRESSGGFGWSQSAFVIRNFLDKLNVPQGEEIAIDLIGSNPAHKLEGAPVVEILDAMEKSNKELVVYEASN